MDKLSDDINWHGISRHIIHHPHLWRNRFDDNLNSFLPRNLMVMSTSMEKQSLLLQKIPFRSIFHKLSAVTIFGGGSLIFDGGSQNISGTITADEVIFSGSESSKTIYGTYHQWKSDRQPRHLRIQPYTTTSISSP
jgi:hypothetical protein